MGCPFCCLAAEKLKSVFPYTEENGILWRKLLCITKELIGDITDVSVCYFATEPFDNPDYEDFVQDFYQLMGRYPQTTTAAGVRDIRRTKAFLGLLGGEPLRQAALRLSVVSLEQMEQIHREFSPKELEFVELLLNNPESSYAYSWSGRAVALSGRFQEKAFLDSASCICTCGFVVNLARQSIRLVSPHRPDERHPLGMKVYEERAFRGTEGYGYVMQEMINKLMPIAMPQDQPLYPAAYITWERNGYQLKAKGDGIKRIISLSEKEHKCFNLVLEQNLSLNEIFEREELTEFERRKLRRKLEIFYGAGCLEETNV